MLKKYSFTGAIFAAAISLGAFAVSAPASAAIIQVFSNDLAGWQAAAGAPVIQEDFSDGTLVSGFSITFGSSLPGAISGGEYHDRANDVQGTDPLFSFSPGITAFGADWDMSPGGFATGISLFLTFADTSTQMVATEIPNSLSGQFFGIVSDLAIASIRLDEGTQTAGVETFDMDNARFVQAVPEPGMLALFGIGLLGLGIARLRKGPLMAL